MKVLMVNTVCGVGSTGSICVDIAKVLEKQGHECFIAYGQGATTYKKNYKIGRRLENHLHNVGSRLLGKQGYFTKNGTKKFIQFIKEYNPDVLHLHNLHGNYLNLKVLFEYLIKVQKPIVWTLHDCWAYTGKCAHYTDVACNKWQTHCNKCPQLKTYPPSLFLDQSSTMFSDKKKWFTAIHNMTILPVSKWLASEVEKSFLKKYPVVPIYNWVEHNVFKNIEDNDFSLIHNLDSTKFSVLMVSASWGKTDVKWVDVLELAKIIPDDIQLILVGKVEEPKLLPENIKYIDYVHGKKELAKAYSFADVYVHLSTEDTFGKVIAEAMSCGTPAIVYNSTACPEVLGENCGYSVEKRNTKEILQAISLIKQNSKNYYSESCITRVIENFDKRVNINQIIEVYNKYSNL